MAIGNAVGNAIVAGAVAREAQIKKNRQTVGLDPSPTPLHSPVDNSFDVMKAAAQQQGARVVDPTPLDGPAYTVSATYNLPSELHYGNPVAAAASSSQGWFNERALRGAMGRDWSQVDWLSSPAGSYDLEASLINSLDWQEPSTTIYDVSSKAYEIAEGALDTVLGTSEIILGGAYNGIVGILGGVASVPYAVFGGTDAGVDAQNAFSGAFSWEFKSDGALWAVDNIFAPLGEGYQDNISNPLRRYSEEKIGLGATSFLFAGGEAVVEIGGLLLGYKGLKSTLDARGPSAPEYNTPPSNYTGELDASDFVGPKVPEAKAHINGKPLPPAESFGKNFHGMRLPEGWTIDDIFKQGLPMKGDNFDLKEHVLDQPALKTGGESGFRGTSPQQYSPNRQDGGPVAWAGDGGIVIQFKDAQGWDVNKMLELHDPQPFGMQGNPYSNEIEIAIPALQSPANINKVGIVGHDRVGNLKVLEWFYPPSN